jgi:hypothetical protein
MNIRRNRLAENGATKTYSVKKYETTLPNLYNWLKKNEIEATFEM